MPATLAARSCATSRVKYLALVGHNCRFVFGSRKEGNDSFDDLGRHWPRKKDRQSGEVLCGRVSNDCIPVPECGHQAIDKVLDAFREVDGVFVCVVVRVLNRRSAQVQAIQICRGKT